MFVAFLDPFAEVVERRSLGDIVHKDDTMDIVIELLHKTITEAFLASSVP